MPKYSTIFVTVMFYCSFKQGNKRNPPGQLNSYATFDFFRIVLYIGIVAI